MDGNETALGPSSPLRAIKVLCREGNLYFNGFVNVTRYIFIVTRGHNVENHLCLAQGSPFRPNHDRDRALLPT